jgi:transposase-like protein
MDADVVAWQLQTAHPDLLRGMLSTFVQELMGAEAQALCGAGFGERSSGCAAIPPRADGMEGHRSSGRCST